ncbi:MBL fold metallo-hydrolase [Candidatus Symbiothrix dinenymphae]|uniref:MBL fold metallo-hydrolase n=1 Tax=Candidatus Symbiothrix dinenymphae TaxID=467085 RepID=UPI000702923F|nr:MBL fold metallo-hydrolase [Candidatus Symbiothrix dinenymphae]
MALKFLSLGSGSSGNSYFLGTESYGVLFDAGLPCSQIKDGLNSHRIGLEQIMGLFVTHDHADHIKAVGALSSKYNIPVYATQPVLDGINSSFFVREKLDATSRRPIEKNAPIQIKDFSITAFNVPHDASDCVGYLVEYEQQKWVLATDVGLIDDEVGKHLKMANHLVIEANYDAEMLFSGNYPDVLKERITNGKGHLCNSDTANFLAANFSSHLRNIWLCHLSGENNRAELAYCTVREALDFRSINIENVNLVTLERAAPSKMYVLE